jgi:hypothetical protein
MQKVFVLAFVLVAMGCSKSATPESVCSHQTSLMAKEFGSKIPEKERAESNAKCLTFNTALQKENPAKWKCHSGCVLAAKTVLETMGCKKSCP